MTDRSGSRQWGVGSGREPRRAGMGGPRRRLAVRVAGCAAWVVLAAVGSAGAQPLAAKDVRPYQSTVYNVTFNYPKKDWLVMPAAGGNIALLMHKKGEASLALDFQVLRVALAPDEIDDTFKEIELEALTARAPHARIVSSALSEMGGNKTIVIRYASSGATGDLDVTQYSVVNGASLYRLTCAATRVTAVRHAAACETAARSLVIGGK